MWNLLCRYNNINVSLHQYLKEKKIQCQLNKQKGWTNGEKKEDSRNQSTVAATMLHSANTLDAQYQSTVAA